MLMVSDPMPVRRAVRRLVAVGSAIAAMAGISACRGLTSVEASFDNVSDSLDFYAINGAPPGAPTAINLYSGIASHANQVFAYDIAFDINAAGSVVLIPARLLATQFSTPYSVGLQRVAGTSFSALDHAPKDGYVVDSVLVVGVGAVVAIESHDAARCGFAIKGQTYFSKLVITSVDLTTRKIGTKIGVDRNCGFRSFADGRPKD